MRIVSCQWPYRRLGQVKMKMTDLFHRYLPWLPEIPLYQGMSWDPTWKALPTFRVVESVWRNRMKLKIKGKAPRSCFTSVPYEIPMFQFLLTTTHALGVSWSQGCLWPERVNYYRRFIVSYSKRAAQLKNILRTYGPIMALIGRVSKSFWGPKAGSDWWPRIAVARFTLSHLKYTRMRQTMP